MCIDQLCCGGLEFWGRKALHQDQVQQVLDACQIKPLSPYTLSLSILHESFLPPSVSYSISKLGTQKVPRSLWSQNHTFEGLFLRSKSYVCQNDIEMFIQDIKCPNPWYPMLTLCRHSHSRTLRRCRAPAVRNGKPSSGQTTCSPSPQFQNALPLFLVAARAAWQSLTAWCWWPSRKIAPPLWRLELQSPPSR